MQKIAKLIKVSDNHFVVGIEEPVKEGDYGVLLAHGHRGTGRGWFIFKHDNSQVSKLNSLCTPLYKITHSTQVSVLDIEEQEKIIKLDLSEIKALIGEVDIESKAWDWIDLNSHKWSNNNNEVGDNYGSFIEGYIQCLRDNAEKKFTEKDVRKAWGSAYADALKLDDDDYKPLFLDDFLKLIRPKNEWTVEFDGHDKLKLV